MSTSLPVSESAKNASTAEKRVPAGKLKKAKSSQAISEGTAARLRAESRGAMTAEQRAILLSQPLPRVEGPPTRTKMYGGVENPFNEDEQYTRWRRSQHGKKHDLSSLEDDMGG